MGRWSLCRAGVFPSELLIAVFTPHSELAPLMGPFGPLGFLWFSPFQDWTGTHSPSGRSLLSPPNIMICKRKHNAACQMHHQSSLPGRLDSSPHSREEVEFIICKISCACRMNFSRHQHAPHVWILFHVPATFSGRIMADVCSDPGVNMSMSVF